MTSSAEETGRASGREWYYNCCCDSRYRLSCPPEGIHVPARSVASRPHLPLCCMHSCAHDSLPVSVCGSYHNCCCHSRYRLSCPPEGTHVPARCMATRSHIP